LRLLNPTLSLSVFGVNDWLGEKAWRTTGAFAEAARLAERAAARARAGGDLADASLQLGIAAAGHVLVGDAPSAVPLAREALTLARQIGDPTLIATALHEVAAAVVETDPNRPAPAYARALS